MTEYSRSVIAAGALGLLSFGAAPAQAYPIDCAILLCMAGGFPTDPVCAAAYAEVIRRITPWPIEPPLQIWNCPMGVSHTVESPILERLREAAYRQPAPSPSLGLPILPTLTPGADIDISGPAFDFVRSLRVYHHYVDQYEDQEENGDVCRREEEVSVGLYDAQGRFEWYDADLEDFPADFAAISTAGCRAGTFGAVFMDWRDADSTYNYEQINY